MLHLRPAALLVLAALLPAQGTIHPTLLQAPPPGPLVAAARRDGLPAGVARALPAVVHVFVEVQARPPFPIVRPSSGVLLDPSGLLLTQWALVAESDGQADKRILVQVPGGSSPLPAKVVARDQVHGLCLLQVEGGKDLPYLELADSAGAAPGTGAVVLSYHDGKDQVAFAGVVAPPLAAIAVGERTVPAADMLLTDAGLDSRGQGAALVDEQGRLLGLCSTEHLAREVQEPTLLDLKRPSFGFAVTTAAIRAAFAQAFAAPGLHNPTLAAPKPPATGPAVAAVAAAAAAVVRVWAGDGEPPLPTGKDPGAAQRVPGLGSGVLVSRTGLVLTDLHLLGARRSARVTLADGRTLPAEVKKAHAASNTVLLQLQLPAAATVPAIACGDDQQAKPGETVFGLGRPDGKGLLVTRGVLSARRDQGRLQVDASLGNQNAGGALVDATGTLLGIVDGGQVDRVDMAYAMQGDQAKTETNLCWCTGIAALRRAYAAEIDGNADEHDSLRAAAAPSPAQLQQRRTPVTDLVAQFGPAMLNVYVSWTSAKADTDSNPFAEQKQAEVQTQSLGSGVIVHPSGLAISNWHVVDDATEADGTMKRDHVVSVRTFDGKSYAAKVLAISREDDLSLLQLVLPPGAAVTAIEFGDSDALQLGDGAVAIGNPHGLSNTITAGIVTALGQSIQVKGRFAKLEHLIETDAAINGGNSGGALLDHQGRLIGINSAGSHGISARGYAIAVNHVRQQLRSLLLSEKKLRSPALGCTVVDQDGVVKVATVDPDLPAGRAGVQRGDVVRSLDGVAITWSVGYSLQLLLAAPERPLALGLERDGKPVPVTVTPLSADAAVLYLQTGLTARTFPVQEAGDAILQAAAALQKKFTGDPKAEPQSVPASAVRIEQVHPRLRAANLDVQPGDLLLAVELPTTTGGDALLRCAEVGEVQRLFNDRELGSYDGREFRCWFARNGQVRVVPLVARRQLW